MNRSLIGAVVALSLVGCGAGATAESTRPRESTPTPAPTATPGVGLVAVPVTLKDKKGDLVDEDDKKVGKNARVDILSVTASADGEDLRLWLELAGKVPEQLSSNDQEIVYAFDVATDGSDDTTSVLIGNVEAGGWEVSFLDRMASGRRFPGSFVTMDNVIGLTIPLEALGYPSSLRIATTAQRVDHQSGRVLANDDAPKDGIASPSDTWLALEAPSGTVPLPTGGVPLVTGGSGGCYLNSAAGPLIADPTYGTAIIDRDVRATRPVPVAWRPGFTAAWVASEVEVRDPDGNVVATTGRSYRIDGGYVDWPEVPTRVFWACDRVTALP